MSITDPCISCFQVTHLIFNSWNWFNSYCSLQITAEVGQKIELKLFRFAYTTEKTNSIIDGSNSPCRQSLVIIDGTNQREVGSLFHVFSISEICFWCWSFLEFFWIYFRLFVLFSFVGLLSSLCCLLLFLCSTLWSCTCSSLKCLSVLSLSHIISSFSKNVIKKICRLRQRVDIL